MSRTEPLPSEVEAVLAEYRERLDGEGVLPLRGLYLVGSIALGDFRPDASDIDFVALLDALPSDQQTQRLARVHARLSQEGGPHLDGIYVSASMLREPAPAEAVVPFSVEGRFRAGEICREANPAVWRCLARYGRRVLGPPLAELGIADDEEPLRAHQITNLRGYWHSWIDAAETAITAKAPGEDGSAAALAWGVLGVSRCACTLATGDIVSKAGGGRFGLNAYPAAWHPLLREALVIHEGGPDRVSLARLREALAYMRFVIAAATG